MNQAEIKKIAVIGAGLMGFGIAVEYARFGYDCRGLRFNRDRC